MALSGQVARRIEAIVPVADVIARTVIGDRVDPDPDDVPDASPRVPECRGMILHAAVSVPARDRRRLERLCRYVARPPLASGSRSGRMAGCCFA